MLKIKEIVDHYAVQYIGTEVKYEKQNDWKPTLKDVVDCKGLTCAQKARALEIFGLKNEVKPKKEHIKCYWLI